MMRTIEVLIVIVILLASFAVISTFTVLPAPRQVAPLNLRRLALTSLQTLDSDHDLSEAAFDIDNDTTWNHVQVALSAMLPADIIYNLTIYEINSNASETKLYTRLKSVSNAENLGVASDSSQYSLASSNVTFNVTPEKIGEHGDGGTLYILNCSDANGWWITGYTARSLAEDLYRLLSPYFVKTVMVQNTTQLGQILGNSSLQGEIVQNAVVINTCGEAVPIPTAYCTAPYSANSYANYSYALGQKVRLYNWTWASIVGYPFYYVSNTVNFNSTQNNWGIYGMNQTGQSGVRAFLQGLDNQQYSYDSNGVTNSVGVVTLNDTVVNYCDYYGIYPSSYQTSTRALNLTKLILTNYNLTVGLYVFNQFGDCLPGAIYNHVFTGATAITGSFLALGLTRTPDVRLTAISLLSYYHPSLYGFPEYTIYGTSRLAVLQLGIAGGTGA